MSLDYDAHNPEFEKAMNLVASTNSNLFLTGEAGTGKTHFLTSASERIKKPHVVLAPTGVAAQYAGGVTIHSFFQLPIRPYMGQFDIPGYTKRKLEILKCIKLIFIDEVSMVRADMLDWINKILQSVHKSELPFGGVQVVLIGDPFQLSPIVTYREKRIYSDYDSPYFFSANVFDEAMFSHIELKKQYRQSDDQFLEILNRIRNRKTEATDLHRLNERVLKKGDKVDLEKSIFLTTHVANAEMTNSSMLEKLESPIKDYDWIQSGQAIKRSTAVEKLRLAIGAKVMVNKNIRLNHTRLYNGQIGRVSKLEDDAIMIVIDGNEYRIEREEWVSYNYSYNAEAKKVEREEVSKVSQFPLMLAWAITIHKSQGLTFESLIADVSNSFSEGQVYVALSRCKSLEGLKLIQTLDEKSIKVNPKVVDFMNKSNPSELLDLRILLNSNRR